MPLLIPQQIQASREMAKKAEEGIENSVSNLVDISTKLEQDNMETGVDEKEWVSLLFTLRSFKYYLGRL